MAWRSVIDEPHQNGMVVLARLVGGSFLHHGLAAGE
jgi:hypothetical protein